MKIRRYDNQDLSSLIDFWREVFPNEPPHNEPSAMIRAKLAVDDLIFVVEDEGKIIGGCMVGYDGHRGWLYAVAVSAEYRRQGIGADLVKYAIEALSKLGCVKINLQIRPTNTEVAAFYKSVGFKIEDRLSMGTRIG